MWGLLFMPMVKLVSGGCGVAVAELLGVGGVETAERNCVMVGWDGSVVLRVRLRAGGRWRRLRAARLGGERDVTGDWAAFGGGMGSSGSWLFHTSQCKALQVCSGRARELGTGSSAGSSS